MTRLSDNFTLAEMCASDYAERHGLNNRPVDAETVANLTEVCMVLERVRKLAGAPIIVSSGYRSPKVNQAIGGSKTSAHMAGLAADIRAVGMTARELALKIAPLVQEFGIDQLIFEGSWTHIGLRDNPRGQILTARFGGGGVKYEQGIL